jgi:outer membrane immunogenic protein
MKIVSVVTTAFAGAAACALVAGSAAAQPEAPVDWTGLYGGLNLGADNPNTQAGASTAATHQLTGVNSGAGVATVPPATFNTRRMDYSNSGVTGGAQVGYNRQMGHIVLGIEGDVEAQGHEHYHQFSTYSLPATALTTGSTETIGRFTEPYLTSTIRARAGMALGPVLFYGAGGLAIAEVRQSSFYGYAPAVTAATAAANPGASFGPYSNQSDNDRQLLTGWTVGGGAEWRLNRMVSVGAEYRHMDFGKHSYSGGSVAPNNTFETTRLGYGDNQLLGKVNFHF